MQTYLAWLKLFLSLFSNLKFYVNLGLVVVITFILLLFIHLTSFANNYWYKHLQALLPEFYISSYTEPSVENFNFEQHLVNRNLNLNLEAQAASLTRQVYLPDLRVRTASKNFQAQFIYPKQNEIYLTQPLYTKINELNINKLGLIGFDNQIYWLEPKLIPLATNERWLVLAPEVAEELRDLGPSLMQQWLPLTKQNTLPTNKDLAQLAKMLDEQELRYEKWQDLLPLSSRLSFTLFNIFSSLLSLVFFIFSSIFILIFSQSLLTEIRSWLNFAAFFVNKPIKLISFISLTFALLSGCILLIALKLELLFAQEVIQFLPNNAVEIWRSSLPNSLWLALSLLVGLITFLLLATGWRSNRLGFWQSTRS